MMKTSIEITSKPIEENQLLAARATNGITGAALYFSGLVRDLEGSEKIFALEYEAFIPMAKHQFELLFKEIESRWPIQSIRVVHRIGIVPADECSLWVEVLSGHRGEAFAACQFLIDEMKKKVPIWKKPANAG
jgi:molybdopterin synthase catalytic subunit